MDHATQESLTPQTGFRERNGRPLRFLSLEDWGIIDDLALEEFDELRRRIIKEPFEECETLIAQTIVRACSLLFSLVESGGLCTPNPEKDIERLRIDIRSSLVGYLRWPGHRPRSNRREVTIAGPRQHLYLLGRVHLLAFINFRIKRYKIHDDDPLLPPLPPTASLLKKTLNGELEWLRSLKGKVTWGHIFRAWLDNQLFIIRKQPSSSSWRNVVELALWQLLKRDRYPIIIAARRGRLKSAPIPDEQINDIFFNFPYRRENITVARDNDAAQNTEIHSDQLILDEDDGLGDPEAAINHYSEPEEEGEGTKSTEAANYNYVRRFLAMLRDDSTTRSHAARLARGIAISDELACGPESELRYLLKWMAELLDRRRTFSTVYTYSNRILRLLYALSPYSFSKCTTEDMAAYLDDYASVSTVKVVRNTARQFYEYLDKHGLVKTEAIRWSSKTLQVYDQYRERSLITEQEYQRARAAADTSTEFEMRLRRRVLLTLLRRCGLRACEAAWLRPVDFRGIIECRLRVFRSKTKTGRGRMLPLYLLLDAEELAELLDFIRKREMEDGLSTYLFVDSAGERSKSLALARDVEKLLRQAGVKGETAHGLRHAFASSLFAALWLNIVADQGKKTGGQARRTLALFCRPGIETRAVTHPYHIQLLLGHADLWVTFERYVHLVDIAIADAVRIAEWGREEKEFLSHNVVAQIADSGKKELREQITHLQMPRGKVRLSDIEKLLRNRVGRYA